MTIQIDDPRVTAYAIGELRGAKRREFERDLASHPEVQREVAELQVVARELRASLLELGEATPIPRSLGKARREAIDAAIVAAEQQRKGAGAPSSEVRASAVADTGADAEVELPNSVPALSPAPGRAAQGAVLSAGVDEEPVDFRARRKVSASRLYLYGSLAAAALLTLGGVSYVRMQREAELKAQQLAMALAQEERMQESLRVESEARARKVDELSRQAGPALGDSTSRLASLSSGERQAGGAGLRAGAGRLAKEAALRLPPRRAGVGLGKGTAIAFRSAKQTPESTFPIDVGRASYTLARYTLEAGELPLPATVRAEEFVNSFHFDYSPPTDGRSVAVYPEIASTPWAPHHRLVRLGLVGAAAGDRPAVHLVLLVDVSISMEGADRLGLAKASLRSLVARLRADDRVSLVTYAGAARVVLPPTAGTEKASIVQAIDQLEARGASNGEDGIRLAYAQARSAFIPAGTNRILLATDGEFNEGMTSFESLKALAQREAKGGIGLSVLGFGPGRVNERVLQALADGGGGSYSLVAQSDEVEDLRLAWASGLLPTVAQKVKVQVEFDAAQVSKYRLLGYEGTATSNGASAPERRDAGDWGAGRTLTALYEVELATGNPVPGGAVDLGVVRVRYQPPDGGESQLIAVPLRDTGNAFTAASPDFQFAAAVAGTAMLLQRSPSVRGWGWYGAYQAVHLARGMAPQRREFVDLVERADRIASLPPPPPPRAISGATTRSQRKICDPGDPLCTD